MDHASKLQSEIAAGEEYFEDNLSTHMAEMEGYAQFNTLPQILQWPLIAYLTVDCLVNVSCFILQAFFFVN